MKKIIIILVICALNLSFCLAQDTRTHTVKRGETIESIAQKYGTTVEAIKSANPNMGKFFIVGMKLNIPTAIPTPVIPVTPDNNNNVTDKLKTSDKQKELPKPQTNQDEQNNSRENSQYIIDKDNESLADKWTFYAKLGAIFYKTQKTGNTYTSSLGFEIVVFTHYHFTNNFYISGGLGYLKTSASTFILRSTSKSQKDESVAHNMILPVELGVRFPLYKNTYAFFIEAGPNLGYAVGGYTQIGEEKLSFSEVEKKYGKGPKRFGAFIRLTAGFDIDVLRLNAFYAIPLSEKAANFSQDKNFWGIDINIMF